MSTLFYIGSRSCLKLSLYLVSRVFWIFDFFILVSIRSKFSFICVKVYQLCVHFLIFCALVDVLFSSVSYHWWCSISWYFASDVTRISIVWSFLKRLFISIFKWCIELTPSFQRGWGLFLIFFEHGPIFSTKGG